MCKDGWVRVADKYSTRNGVNMDDGLRVAVSGNEVTIYQNAGDPDFPEDEIGISMTAESFRKIVAISEIAFGVKVRAKPQPSERFAEFWAAYPNKVAKDKAARSWSSVQADDIADEIIGALESCKTSEQWVKDNGRFIPHASTWLNNRRWTDAESTAELGVFK